MEWKVGLLEQKTFCVCSIMGFLNSIVKDLTHNDTVTANPHTQAQHP